MVDVTSGMLERSHELANAVAAVLEESAERIDRDGFSQGQFWDPETGTYCTRGMFTQVVFERYMGSPVVGGVDLWKNVIDWCDIVLVAQIGEGVATWNDTPGRTKVEVVETLAKTAAELRAGCAA